MILSNKISSMTLKEEKKGMEIYTFFCLKDIRSFGIKDFINRELLMFCFVVGKKKRKEKKRKEKKRKEKKRKGKKDV